MFQLLSNKKKVSTTSNSNLGLLLLVLSLCMDGVCGMQQDVVVPRFKPSSLRLQVMLNVYGTMIALVASLFSQELLPGLSFLLENRVCLLVAPPCRLAGVTRSTAWSTACASRWDRCSSSSRCGISRRWCCRRSRRRASSSAFCSPWCSWATKSRGDR